MQQRSRGITYDHVWHHPALRREFSWSKLIGALDFVAGEPEAAAAAFQQAMNLALEYLKTSLAGLEVAGVQAGEARRRACSALTGFLSELGPLDVAKR